MKKTAIKNYAIWARKALMDAVKQNAYEYQITEHGTNDCLLDSIDGKPVCEAVQRQRKALIERIAQNGFTQTMEEAAYTWFNRLISLRYMEVNGYLPSGVRVFTDETGAFKPEILSEAMNMEIDGLDRDYVLELLEMQDNETLYKYLLIMQCNALHESMPEMFETIGGWAELLFPKHLLRSGSIVDRMIREIPEEDWKDQVQIIGWMYQYYNTEPKEQVFSRLKKNVKITKENIPAATQLFTPDWIVRYMVENSLGRLWMEGHPNFDCSAWHYYLEDTQPMQNTVCPIKPEQIRIIDPCMGSGHILVYAFDLLMQIYTANGWSERDAAERILTQNLYGLDIDKRAYQLAYFALMMKARRYNRRILTSGIRLNLAHFQDLSPVQTERLEEPLRQLAEQFRFADTYGSLLDIRMPDGIDEALAAGTAAEHACLERMVQIAHSLGQHYDVVVTNPPYMGSSGMEPVLSTFVREKFSDYKADLFSAFLVRCTQLAKPKGYLGFLTPYVWMFIRAYEKLRQYIAESKTIETLIQFEYSAFEEATVPICTFVLRNWKVNKKGCYIRLTECRGGMEVQRLKALEAIANHNCGYYYETNAENFSKIPGAPIAYWANEAFFAAFAKGIGIASISDFTGAQNKTADNATYLRYVWEVARDTIGRGKKWVLYAKGGEYRKYYGNLSLVIDWSDDARTFYQTHPTSNLLEESYWYQEGITYTMLTSRGPNFRYLPPGAVFDMGGPTICALHGNMAYVLGLFNCKVMRIYLELLNPTLNLQVKDVKALPILIAEKNAVDALVQETIALSKSDWDSYETALEFAHCPLV